MKTTILRISAYLLFVSLIGTGCRDYEKPDLVISDDIGNVISVFELKYGELKEIIYNGDTVAISIVSVEDSVTVDCSLADFSNNQDAPLSVRINSYLQINNQEKILKVTSKPCGALPYESNGHDVLDIYELIDEIKSAPANIKDSLYFKNTFRNFFGQGSPIAGISLHIFIAKVFPTYYSHPNSSIEDYRFVFIVTTKE